jgi:hypothetical protein
MGGVGGPQMKMSWMMGRMWTRRLRAGKEIRVRRSGSAAVSLIVVAVARTVLSAEPDAARPSVRLEMHLVDGSRVLGTTVLETIPVRTPYARVVVPLRLMAAARIDARKETLSVQLSNGDTLTGVADLEPVRLATVFGSVVVAVEHIAEIHVLQASRALPAALRKGLLVQYSFDRDEGERIADGSGNGHHAEGHGPTWTPRGKLGGALQFDGIDDYVTHSTRSLGPDGSPYSVSLWFKTREITPTLQFLMSGNSPSSYLQNACDLYVTPEGSVHFGANDRDQRVQSAKESVVVDTWCHVVAVADGRARHLYVNGELVVVRLDQPNDAQWHTDRFIGRRHVPGTFFRGLMDDIMVFDRALCADEAKAIYDSQR